MTNMETKSGLEPLGVPPLACGIADAAAAFNVEKSTFRRNFVDTGIIKPRKIGARSVYLIDDLKRAAGELPAVDLTKAR